MGGYGSSILNGVVRAGSAVFGTAGGIWPGRKAGEGVTESAEGKVSKDTKEDGKNSKNVQEGGKNE